MPLFRECSHLRIIAIVAFFIIVVARNECSKYRKKEKGKKKFNRFHEKGEKFVLFTNEMPRHRKTCMEEGFFFIKNSEIERKKEMRYWFPFIRNLSAFRTIKLFSYSFINSFSLVSTAVASSPEAITLPSRATSKVAGIEFIP